MKCDKNDGLSRPCRWTHYKPRRLCKINRFDAVAPDFSSLASIVTKPHRRHWPRPAPRTTSADDLDDPRRPPRNLSGSDTKSPRIGTGQILINDCLQGYKYPWDSKHFGRGYFLIRDRLQGKKYPWDSKHLSTARSWSNFDQVSTTGQNITVG